MKKTFVLSLLLCVSLAGMAGEASTCFKPADNAVRKKTLNAFASEAELEAFLKCVGNEFRQHGGGMRSQGGYKNGESGSVSKSVAVASAMPAAPASMAKEAKSSDESVTNTQTAGVDEGGIVKVHGPNLVVLRRGRLFTINIDHGQMKPVAMIDAYAPDADPRGAWYDEMLIEGNTIVVIGYSYARGGTEIGLFNIDGAGKLSYRATYHLRSNDYYSSRNYASRLVGSKLIFYTPLQINFWYPDPYAAFPAVRKWRKEATPADFKRIAPATRIYRTDDPIEPYGSHALHTVTICDLSTPEMECQATAVMGPAGRVFYVSAQSVYVWTNNYARSNAPARSAIFRIPLDGSAPTALKTAGAPIDQFSFLESEDKHLNVLVRSQGRGDAMWAAEGSRGDVALLRVPLGSFGDGRDGAPVEAYKRLPHPSGYTLQNRFIGNFLLYGAGDSWGRPKGEVQNLYAVRWDNDSGAQALPLTHGVDRIEALGSHAVTVGTQGNDLYFSSIELKQQATLMHAYVRKNAAQGETRSHGFFYKPASEREGLVGLPIVGAGRPGYQQLQQESAAVLYLRNRSLKLTELGALESKAAGNVNDGCRASCVDWYGNSRPLFLKNRVFALMGYELVEGRISGEKVGEVRRINYAPQSLVRPIIAE